MDDFEIRSAYVILDDVTKVVVQVSDNIDPSTWIPDSNNIDPFIPSVGGVK